MMHIRMQHCNLKDLDTIYILSQTLAHYFPRPEQYVTGIYELLINALEHGNLGIGYEEKSKLVREEKWLHEIERRMALPEYASKAVDIRLTQNRQECILTITDEGQGFPWQHYLGRLMNDRRPNGRGLWIAMNSKFDRLLYNPAGNQVTCVVQYDG
jgi:two-component system cell cycle response regulator